MPYSAAQRLRQAPVEELRTELYNHGYRATEDNDYWGPDQMDPDDLFDTLVSYYEQYPEKDPGRVED